MRDDHQEEWYRTLCQSRRRKECRRISRISTSIPPDRRQSSQHSARRLTPDRPPSPQVQNQPTASGTLPRPSVRFWVVPFGNDSRLKHGAKRCLDSESILRSLQPRHSRLGHAAMRYFLFLVTSCPAAFLRPIIVSLSFSEILACICG